MEEGCVILICGMCSVSGIDNGIYTITDSFYGDLSSFTIPSNVKAVLTAYTAFTA